MHTSMLPLFFFFNDTATTEIYTLSLHDALPISRWVDVIFRVRVQHPRGNNRPNHVLHHRRAQFRVRHLVAVLRSEEHTSELQSRLHLVCRLLLEKKKNYKHTYIVYIMLAPLCYI